MSLVAASLLLLWFGLRETFREPATATAQSSPRKASVERQSGSPAVRDSTDGDAQRLTFCGRVSNYDPQRGPGVVTLSVALPGTAHPIQSATLSPEGRFELSLVPHAPLVVAITAPGSPATSHYIPAPLPCARERYEFELPTGHATHIRGTVADVFGGPIASAQIDVIPRGHQNGFGFRQPVFRTSSTDAGEFSIVVPANHYVVRAAFPGYSTASTVADTTRRELETVALTLSPGATVSGRVVRSADGRGMPNAELRLVGLADGEAFINHASRADAVSGPDGVFVIDDVGVGAWAIYASSDQGISAAPTEVSVDLYADVQGVLVMVDEGTPVRGLVRERESDQPVAEALVMLQSESLALTCSPSDRAGAFDCGLLPRDSYTALVSHEQYAGSLLGASVVVGAAPEQLELELERGHTIAGRLSPPIAGVPIRVRMSPEDLDLRKLGFAMMNAFRTATTDAEGRFRVGPLALGELTLIAEHLEHGRGEARVDRATAESGQAIEIVLTPAGVLTGRISNLGETDGAALELVLTPIGEPQRIDGTRSAGAAMYTIPIDTRGDFQAAGLEAGRFALQLRHARGVVRFEGPEQIELRDGEHTQLALELAATQLRFFGVVVDERGEPVEGAVIQAADDRSIRALSDDRGEFTLAAWSEATTLPIRYHRAGHTTAATDASLRAGERNQLVVATASSLTIEHPGVSSGRVILTRETRVVRPASPSGVTVITGLLAGRHEVHVCGEHAYGRGEIEIEIEIELGEREATVTIDAEPWITITGTALGPGGEPLIGAQVFALPSHDPCGVFRRAAMAAFAGSMPLTDDDGAFTLSGLPPGSTTLYFIDASTDPPSERMTTVELAPGDEPQQLGEVRL